MIDVAAFIEWFAVLVPLFVLFGFVWAPKTWTPGELVTAASMNTNIRDHLNETLRSQTSVATGSEDDFALDGPFTYLKLNNASALEITGALVDSGNIDGSRVIFEAINSAVTLRHQNASSASANRFINDSATDIVLGPGERAYLFYDTANTRWRVGKASTGALLQSLGAVNLHPDPYLIMWPRGNSSAPAGAVLTLDGNSAITREQTIWLFGGMSCMLTRGNTSTVDTLLTYTIFSSLPVSWRGKTIGIGCYLKSNQVSLGVLKCDDGGTGGADQSVGHDGDNTWQWISFIHTITSDATKLDVSLACDKDAFADGDVYFDGITITEGPLAPDDTKPAPTIEKVLYIPLYSGNVSTGTRLWDYDDRLPFIVTNVSLRAITAPTGAALIVDVNHWTGAAFSTMFTTKPQIAAAASPPVGGGEPDGTYRNRCFLGRKNTDLQSDGILTVDIDQVGSGTPGANLTVAITIVQYQDPLRGLKL